MSIADRAAAEAHAAVAEAIGASYTRRQFTISRFDVHPDGYYHARVVVNGQPYYLHRRYGSWLAPGVQGNLTVAKEPEALLGSVLGREVKFALAEKARAHQRSINRRENPDAAPEDAAPAP